MGNRPDCAYFLLLGLCVATFLIAIGGILTYNLTFNFHSTRDESHPHHLHNPHSQHEENQQSLGNEPTKPPRPSQQKNSDGEQEKQMKSGPIQGDSNGDNNSSDGESQFDQHISSGHQNSPLREQNSQQRSGNGNETPGGSLEPQSENKNKTADSSSHNATSSRILAATGQGKRNESYVLAIIGPLCLLAGIVVTLIVGVFALKYDCDHEPEPEIAFLRLRSELSLNFDHDKNNYELLRRVPTTVSRSDEHVKANSSPGTSTGYA